MNCEQMAELLPDYLQESLTGDQATLVERHCEHCTSCARDVALWKKLALVPVDQPSSESRARFEAMLHAYPIPSGENAAATSTTHVSGRFERQGKPAWIFINWLRSPVGAVAWSVAVLVLGILIGTRVNDNQAPTNNGELTAMHTELASMRQLVALSMLQQQSASERLQGVSWSGREDHLDPQVQAALLRTLRYDTSVDVRLAALDALSRHASQPQVRKGVVDALQEQQSPLVQVALIDQLAEWRDPGAAQLLRNFQQTPNLNPTVRQRAEWAISKLQSQMQ
jgi:anti-sigma factor RsiW